MRNGNFSHNFLLLMTGTLIGIGSNIAVNTFYKFQAKPVVEASPLEQKADNKSYFTDFGVVDNYGMSVTGSRDQVTVADIDGDLDIIVLKAHNQWDGKGRGVVIYENRVPKKLPEQAK